VDSRPCRNDKRVVAMKTNWIEFPISKSGQSLYVGSLQISGNDIHIWLANINQQSIGVDKLRLLLSANELERAGGFRFAVDRNRFVVSHGLLRIILSAYTNLRPEFLNFGHTDYGKPYLSNCEINIAFSMSHSRDYAFYGLASGGEIGVDIEFIRNMEDIDKIAESYFPKNDRLTIGRLPKEQKQKAFFECWTQREAFIKAIGFLPDKVPECYSGLLLQTLLPVPGYVAAVAVEDIDPQFGYFQVTT